MKVKSKKTGDIHYISSKDWGEMEKRDGGSQRRYIIVDRQDIAPKQEHIPIQDIKTIAQEIKLPLTDIAIYSSGFNTEDYSIPKWTEFLEDKDIEDYRTILEDDSRIGIKNLLNG